MVKLRALFLFTCCLILAIGPLNLMQMVAWGNMLHDYSKDRSITEAAEMTFSGDYPCEMCRKIAEAKSKENTTDQSAPKPSDETKSLRLDLYCDNDALLPRLKWMAGSSFLPGGFTSLPPASRYQRVPTPPPQALSC